MPLAVDVKILNHCFGLPGESLSSISCIITTAKLETFLYPLHLSLYPTSELLPLVKHSYLVWTVAMAFSLTFLLSLPLCAPVHVIKNMSIVAPFLKTRSLTE